ncbi:MAG TPA: cold shock domain-containing protein [Pseudonocardiaceae bacterium]|nr:cold shock domain-containing protein [Pseudonocardiaceae bacterium]
MIGSLPDVREVREGDGKVKEWSDDHGWGVIVSPEVGEVWAHHVHLDQDGFRALTPGESVELGYIDMSPGTQDGYRYRAAWVRRVAPRAP